MLRRQHEVFRSLLLLGDLVLVGASWLGAYAIRFHSGLPVPKGLPPLEPYLWVLPFLLPVWAWVFRRRGLYAPRRIDSPLSELVAVGTSVTLVVFLLVSASFFVRSYYLSRGVILLFWALSFLSVALFRLVARKVLFALHRRGRHLSSALVVGGERQAEQVIDRLHGRPEFGLRVVGVLSEVKAARVRGVPVLGRYEQMRPVLHLCGARQVIVALPREDGHRLETLLDQLEDELVDIRLVPDLLHVATLHSSVEDFDGLPVINLRESPLVGWAAIQKRAFDVVMSALLLLLTAPIMGLIALAIRLSAGSPVLYRQERMGLDGHVFDMLKFRTMVNDAERETGPVWARRGDPRETRVGSLLRRTSLDELPQLWNVLRGDMSLVGPRPERPVFIEQFRREVPGYMLRHKVKAGLTGWAQVHRWRGDTSLHERIEHDLYYIRNWSLGLDIRILLMTLWRVRLPG